MNAMVYWLLAKHVPPYHLENPMSDPYTPPEPVSPQEEVVADPAKPYKAYASAAVSAIGAFIVYWVADDASFTSKDAGEAFLAALAVGAPGFGLVYTITNPKVTKPLARR